MSQVYLVHKVTESDGCNTVLSVYSTKEGADEALKRLSLLNARERKEAVGKIDVVRYYAYGMEVYESNQ